MADSKQFGTPKVLQFGDKMAGNRPGDSSHCAQCEAMLADALDGTLSAADQQIFDVHMAECGPCAQSLADARRGAAWLEMLRTPAPEPPTALLERILSQTSGAHAAWVATSLMHPGTTVAEPGSADGIVEIPGNAPGYNVPAYGNVLPFRKRAVAAVRGSSFGQIMLQPRLAMTAAMAFFSIALTMNLTGIHPLDLKASDLRPSSLKRDFFAANARVVQYYEGLRVVYELESRVHDLQSASASDAAAGSQSTPPASSQESQPDSGKAPAGQSDKNGSGSQSPSAQPEQKQGAPAAKPAPNSGSSRREGLGRELIHVASAVVPEFDPGTADRNSIAAIGVSWNVEGALV